MQVQRIVLALFLSVSQVGLATTSTILAANQQDKTAQIELGYKDVRQGLAEQAIAIFTQVLRTDPNNVRAQLGLAMAQQKAGRVVKAMQEYEKTLKLDPNNHDALREAGRLYSYSEVTWVSAIEVLQRYVKIDPNDPEGRFLLASVQGWHGEHKAAEQNVRTVLTLRPGDTNAKLLLAQVLTWQGRGKEAMPLFNELLGAGKLPNSARHDYALALRQNGNYTESEKLYNQLISETPADKQLKAELADLINERTNAGTKTQAGPEYSKEQQILLDQARGMHQQGRTEEAISFYRKVLAQRPADVKLQMEFIDILASSPSYRDEALNQIDKLFRDKPTRQLQLERAKILSWMPERRLEALAIYREYYRQNPNDEEIRKLLTQVLVWADTDAGLVPLYNEMLQRDPGNEALRLRLAQALLEGKNYTGAIAHLETLLRANPDNFDARLSLAGAYIGAGRVEDSEAQLNLLFQLDPRNVNVLIGLGGVLAKAGEYERAMTYFNRALKESPGNKLALNGLANCYLGMGRPLDAIPLLKKAYEETRDEKIGLQLAEVYQKLKQYNKAQEILNQISPQSRAQFERDIPGSTVPSPSWGRSGGQNPPLEPTPTASKTANGESPVADNSRPRKIGTITVQQPDEITNPKSDKKTDSKNNAVKPPQPLPRPSDAPPMPTDVAARPGVTLHTMNSSSFVQDPDDIRQKIANETAPTLTISYAAFIRSGEEAVAFAGTPDESSFSALVINRIRIGYDFNAGKQLRLGFAVEPTFLNTGLPKNLGTDQVLPGSSSFGKDGIAGDVHASWQPSERFHLNARAGVTLVGDPVGGINGSFQVNDRVQLLLEASRDAISESLLSLAGFNPLGGEGRIGRTRATGGGGGLAIRLDPKTDVTIKFRHDNYTSDGLPDNSRNSADVGVGRDISDSFRDWKQSGLDYFRIGYQFSYFGFNNDQSTIVTDGGDFFGELLVRGYYSPKSFISNGVRIDVAGTYKNKLDYRVAGGLAIQSSRSFASRFNQPGTTAGALIYVNLMYRFTEHFSWGAEYEFNNAGSNYSSNKIGTTVLYRF